MRYGIAKYGSFKYGSGPTIDNLLWGIIVDWDGDGYFTGENEASHVISFRSSANSSANKLRLITWRE